MERRLWKRTAKTKRACELKEELLMHATTHHMWIQNWAPFLYVKATKEHRYVVIWEAEMNLKVKDQYSNNISNLNLLKNLNLIRTLKILMQI